MKQFMLYYAWLGGVLLFSILLGGLLWLDSSSELCLLYHHKTYVPFGVLAIVLLMLLGYLFAIVRLRRRLCELFRALPVRVAVVDGAGRVYFVQANGWFPAGTERSIRSLDDFPPEINRIFSDTVAGVLADGRPCIREFCFNGRRRKAEFVRLPKSMYGTPTVLFVSTDVEELYRARQAKEELADNFQLTLRSIADGVIAVDVNGVVTLLNDAGATILGVQPEAAAGRRFEQIFPKLTRLNGTPVESSLLTAMRSHERVENRIYANLLVDGKLRYFSDCASPIMLPDGTLRGAVMIFRDSTAEVRREQRLEESNSLIQGILDVLPCSLYVKDFYNDDRYWISNRYYRRFLGLDENCDVMAGKTDFDFFPRETALTFVESDAHAMAEKRQIDFLEEMPDRNGTVRTVHAYKMRIRRPHSGDLLLGMCFDVTDFKHIQQQLAQALMTARLANQAKSRFLATISHELRTPLNAVIGFSELLRNGALPQADREDYLQSIQLAGNALLNLINDVLDLSKIEAEQMSIVPAPTDVTTLAQEMHAIFIGKAEEKQLALRISCPGDLPWLALDALRLRQILLNLMGNALKFTMRGEVSLEIGFEPESEKSGRLTLMVTDTGIGVRKDKMKAIFEPFVQQDSVRDAGQFHGTGLGLTISMRLAERMGGVIELESEEGHGSVFRVVLPHVEVTGPVIRKPMVSELTSGDVPKTLRVLLVDDVSMNLKVLGLMLRKMGLESDTAGSGAQAWEMLKLNRYDLVLTDLWMPEMTGQRLAELIRGDKVLKNIGVVAVTADAEAKGHLPSELFDGELLKPLTMEKLREILCRFA